MNTTYFAIRHRPTGFYLPVLPRRGVRKGGHTHSEPTDPMKAPPRLFVEKRNATCALGWWLEGKTRTFFDGDTEDWNTIKVPERKADDMEIVELALFVVTQDRDVVYARSEYTNSEVKGKVT